MKKTNLQVRIPEELLERISEVSPQSKSVFVREAIEEKIRTETNRTLEEKWIKALSEHPEDVKNTIDWLKAESWGPR